MKILVRMRLAASQNRGAILFVLGWIVTAFVVMNRSLHMPPVAAALVAVCVTKAQGGALSVYQSFTEVVVFGVVAAVVVTNVTRKYQPAHTSRALASRADGHVLVVGYTNLGKRLAAMARAGGAEVVVVAEKAEDVETLVRDEDPVVLGNARDAAVLDDANVARAKIVVIATDDLEEAAVACRHVRERNALCEIIVRCPDDDVGAILAKTYRARAVSTSRLAATFVLGHALKARAKVAVVIATNNLASRAAEVLRDKGIQVRTTFDRLEEADFFVLCDDDLGKNLIAVDRIRDVNRRAKIVCRAFHDEAADVLTREPFGCVVLSTSRHAAEALVRAGALREVGITDLPEGLPRRGALALA
jgi:Trk K+ transport system NAD-binding subunit